MVEVQVRELEVMKGGGEVLGDFLVGVAAGG